MRLRILAPLSLAVLTALIAIAALNVRGQNSAASPPPAGSPAVQPSPSPGNDTGTPSPTPQPTGAVVPKVIKVIEDIWSWMTSFRSGGPSGRVDGCQRCQEIGALH